MTYYQLVDKIIADGIAEVREAYADPKDHHKRDGAIEGFEACRGKSPTEIVALWSEAERRCFQVRTESDLDVQTYWKARYKALQLEWVLNVLSVGLDRPLLPHLPTTRAAMKYAAIAGIQQQEAP